MLKLLPIGVLIILILSTLIYFRFFRFNEVAKSAPPISSDADSSEDLKSRLTTLEESLGLVTRKLTEGNNQSVSAPASKTQSPPPVTEARVKAIEDSLAALKIKVDQITPAPAQTSSTQPTLYIPLGSGGSSSDRNWVSIDSYQVELDSGSYPGYSGMQFEVAMKLNESVGTANARFYNSTDSSAVSYSDVSTTSDKNKWLTSLSFKLPAGKKTYKLQLQSTQGYEISLQSARIKVSF